MSVAAFLEVSAFLAVSTTVVLVESTVLVESVVEDEEEPLQAAKETATANAKEAILIEFFMCVIFCVLPLIQQIQKGNP
ncbi:MAG: hypothetical protein ACXVJB_07565 [Mucilaginibacter sp.]